MRQLPDAWRTLTERRGITPSARGIALAAGVAPSTITRLVFDGITSPTTVRVVAEVLGVSTTEVTRIAGLQTSQLGPWDPPVESHRLSARQRDAIDRLILAIVEERDETNGDAPAARKKMPPAGGTVVREPEREVRSGRTLSRVVGSVQEDLHGAEE